MNRSRSTRRSRRSAWLIACACTALGASAQQPSTGAAPRAASGPSGADASLGARIAAQGVPNVAACAGCHGANGEGNAAANFPRIAGQSSAYLLNQLQAYASGARANAVMQPIAKALDDAQRRAVSSHYAALEPGGPAAGAAGSGASAANGGNDRGHKLASVGDEAIRVQACANCHGPGGIGQSPGYPYLAGQVARYLQAALAEWKNGARKTDPSGQMPLIAQRLGDADVRALVAYYAGLPAPPARSTDVASAWRPTRSANIVSGPRTGSSTATQGVGSEQGAGTTGGTQGAGGGGGGPAGSGSSTGSRRP